MDWHLAAIWDVVARTVPDKPALISGARITNWRDYEQRAARLAAALQARGLSHEGRAAILGYNSAGWLEAQYAIMKAGGISVNVNYRYTEAELCYLLENSDAEILLTERAFLPRLRGIVDQLPLLKSIIVFDAGPDFADHDIAEDYEAVLAAHGPMPPRAYSDEELFMLYTGGTTGLPKGVLFRQREYSKTLMMTFASSGLAIPKTSEALVAAVLELHERGLATVSLPAAPFMHGSGLAIGAISPHAAGGCVVILPNEHFSADALWREVERCKVTSLAIVGDAFARPLVQSLEAAVERGEPYDVSSLNFIGSSGVAFSLETKQALLRFANVMISDMMGASEGAMARSVMSRETSQEESGVFSPNPGTKVFNDRDQEILPGSDEIGMIATSGIVPIRYHKDETKSAATFRTIGGVRYSFPGDFAKVAADGKLILLGRGSNCINTGGEKVFCEEVEEVIKTHPGIRDCIVVGVPDDRFGHKVVALISADVEPAADALRDFCRTKLAGYKLPRDILFVDEVRRAPNGKADYGWAKESAQVLVRKSATC